MKKQIGVYGRVWTRKGRKECDYIITSKIKKKENEFLISKYLRFSFDEFSSDEL